MEGLLVEPERAFALSCVVEGPGQIGPSQKDIGMILAELFPESEKNPLGEDSGTQGSAVLAEKLGKEKENPEGVVGTEGAIGVVIVQDNSVIVQGCSIVFLFLKKKRLLVSDVPALLMLCH